MNIIKSIKGIMIITQGVSLSYGNGQQQGGRPYQEDYFGFFRPPSKVVQQRGMLFVLSDGMGGKAQGAVASLLLVEFFRDNYFQVNMLLPANMSVPALLEKLTPLANQALLERGLQDQKYWGMGATLIVAVIAGDRLYWSSVGDSHLYLYRNNMLTLLNADHSMGAEIEQALADGRISEEEAVKNRKHSHRLLHYMGNRQFSTFDLSRDGVDLIFGDRILLCSDGLDGTLDKVAIKEVLDKHSPEQAAPILTSLAVRKGGRDQDNVTVQVIGVEASSKKQDKKLISYGIAAVFFALLFFSSIALIILNKKPEQLPPADVQKKEITQHEVNEPVPAKPETDEERRKKDDLAAQLKRENADKKQTPPKEEQPLIKEKRNDLEAVPSETGTNNREVSPPVAQKDRGAASHKKESEQNSVTNKQPAADSTKSEPHPTTVPEQAAPEKEVPKDAASGKQVSHQEENSAATGKEAETIEQSIHAENDQDVSLKEKTPNIEEGHQPIAQEEQDINNGEKSSSTKDSQSIETPPETSPEDKKDKADDAGVLSGVVHWVKGLFSIE